MDTGETKVYIAFLIAALVLGIILIYFIITILRQQRNNLALHQSKIQAEIITLEKERKRMARDLHDELGPLLLSIKYNLNSLVIGNEEDESTVDKTNVTLDAMIARMREISNDLLPEILLRKGLISALEESADRIRLKSGLAIDLFYDNIPSLPLEKTINLYRILQEIIHNTIKHAAASRMVIEIKAVEKTLSLLAEDDGCGFDYNSQQKDFSGLGLRSLLSRAEIMQGTMYLESVAGKGTRYIFEIPV